MPFLSPYSCRCFIFDLDGTLIDSKADIAFAVNSTLVRLNLRPIPECRVIEFVGHGMRKLVESAIRESTCMEPDVSLLHRGVTLFPEEYGKHLLDHTSLYQGVRETLDLLSWAVFAVASNKPEVYSRKILKGLGIEHRFCTILGEDSVHRRKPDPAPLLKAMHCCRATPSETAMVGDSAVDIEAGKAAGVITCGVPGGFVPRQELIDAGCDLLLENIGELAHHFRPS